MTVPTSIDILIADDHRVVRMGVAAMLHAQPGFRVVAEAENATDACTLYEKHHPGVCVMDLRMPGGGIQAIRQICQMDPKARVLVLSTYTGEEEIHQAIEAGALGYLCKDLEGPDLIEAIQTVFEGKRYLPSALRQRLDERSGANSLSTREIEVLRFVAGGSSNKEIAALLGVSEATVRFHVGNILAKLGARDRTEATTEALRRGIIHLE